MDWLEIIFFVTPLAFFGYEFLAFVHDLERRDKQSRRPPDAP